MAYAKQTWVDHTTPADAAHMNHIEDGIFNADGRGLPAGGLAGQVLSKLSSTDYAAQWSNALTTLSGTLAARPAANTVTIGSLYFATDNGNTYRSDGVSTWTLVSQALPPVVNGQWIKGVGGAQVWSPITAADVSGLAARVATAVSAANTDIAWGGGGASHLTDNLSPSGAASIRSYGTPPTVGTRLVLRNTLGAGNPVTISHNLSGGGGTMFFLRGSVDMVLLGGEALDLVWTGGSYWAEVDRSTPLVGYATTLPASPVDGQETVLVDSVTAPTYQWRFRYNAGSTSSFKWEFIGGPPTNWANQTWGTVAADGTWRNITAGQTLARAGYYQFSGQAAIQGANLGMSLSLGVSLNNASPQQIANAQAPVAASTWYQLATAPWTIQVPSAATSCTLQCWLNGGGTPTVGYVNLSILPVRIS